MFYARPYRLAVLPALLFISGTALADVPPGWISGDFISAYTPNARSVEITGEAIKINDTLDFLDIREDLVAGNRRLTEDSGDLSGFHGTLQVGIFDVLSVFYTRQQQDLTLKVNAPSSINVLEMDEELETTIEEAGVKWTIYQSDFSDSGRAATAATLELSHLRNSSKDFDLTFDSITLNSGGSRTNIDFTDDQVAGMRGMEDDGWRLRLIYTTPVTDTITASTWAGYSRHEASSGTGTTIPIDAIRNALTQTFELDETQHRLGASMNWQITPRIPLQLNYEYIHIANQDQQVNLGTPAAGFTVPGFLRSANLSEENANHTLSASVSWWISPAINVGLTGKIFSNQFLGVIPHYNNPLSASFAEAPYGYVGVRFGVRTP